MRRKVAAGFAFVGCLSLAVAGLSVGHAVYAGDEVPGMITVSDAGSAPVELNAPQGPAKATTEPEGAARQKPASERKSPTQAKEDGGTKKPPTPDKGEDALKGAPAAEKPAEVGKAKKPAAKIPAPARLPLSPQMAALRDRVRAVLASHFREPINTDDNSPAQILSFCLAFGCDTEIRYGNAAGSTMSGIGCLCYDYPCAGYRMLRVSDGKVMARVGYALQESPGEMLAVLAQSAVPDNYEIRAGQWRGHVSDLVEAEKLSCVPGIDLSQKLIGLSYYLPDGATWKNARGDEWSLERLVREELNRSPASDGPEATDHLMGLAYALDRHTRDGRTAAGQYERARKFLAEYEDFALGLQNTDGSWNPAVFSAKGSGRELVGVLRATGHILEWLVSSLPEDRLQDRRVLLSMNYVTSLIENSYGQSNVPSTSTREITALMHALHALRVYDHRVFQQAGPDRPAQPASPSATP